MKLPVSESRAPCTTEDKAHVRNINVVNTAPRHEDIMGNAASKLVKIY
jgi:hypothetical protein